MANYNVLVTGSNYLIEGNNISGNPVEGIDITGSRNTFCNNSIPASGWCGFQIRLNATQNIIADNNLTGCDAVPIEWGSENRVYGNRIMNGGAAFQVTRGAGNVFFANYVANNTVGVRLGYDMTEIARQSGPSAVNNAVYQNSFVNNTVQGTDWNWLGTNRWNNGTAGNFWSDYKGVDSNGDGIGDTPYMLTEAVSYYNLRIITTDKYPLVRPFSASDNHCNLQNQP
jgi:parallel beta-helix repeat protein